jgi:hypothetical protein
LLQEIRDQTKWLRFLALKDLRQALELAVPTSTERMAYELSDGTRSTREVAALAGVSQPTISRWWRQWNGLGLGAVDDRGRFAHLSSLRALGFDVEESNLG